MNNQYIPLEHLSPPTQDSDQASQGSHAQLLPPTTTTTDARSMATSDRLAGTVRDAKESLYLYALVRVEGLQLILQPVGVLLLT